MATPASVEQTSIHRIGKEISIPSTYGHIAGLEWGPSDGKPVLALHGWMDNANSFEPLVHYLPANLHIVAFDFAGHGLTSHLGPGAYYTSLSFMADILQVVYYLKWEKFSIIAHSMGAIVAITFTAHFQDRIENLITLDILYPKVFSKTTPISLSDFFQRHSELEDREFSDQLEVSWDKARELLLLQRGISNTNADLLLSRSLKPTSKNDNYVFTRDHRLKAMGLLHFEQTVAETVMDLFQTFTGTWIAIMQKNDQVIRHAYRQQGLQPHHTKACKLFKILYVDGDEGHFMHMENPELIASYIREVFEVVPKL